MIETERLIIRPVALEDAVFIQKLISSPGFIENIGKRPSETIEATEGYIRSRMLDHYEEYGYGNNAFIRKSDGAKMGTVSLFNRPAFDGVDIGYATLPEYYRKGYTYEAAHALMEYARNVRKMDYLTAYTSYDNAGSLALLKKLGFTFDKDIYWEEWDETSPRFIKSFNDE